MHFAFPYECPYPHRSGVLDKPLSSREWQEKNQKWALVTKAEYKWHMENLPDGDREHMSMWTLEEELRFGTVGDARSSMSLMKGLPAMMQILAGGIVLRSPWRSVMAAHRSRTSGPGPKKASSHLV